MRDLWWTKCHWDRFFPEYFGFPLSISLHLCCITRKDEKKLIIFITGLHNKPQGCGASVAHAAGPFTPPKKNVQVFMYTDTTNVEHGVYDCTANNLGHKNNNNSFKEKFGSHAKKALTDSLQNRATLETSHVIRKVVQSET
jgi:hypothetical protein